MLFTCVLLNLAVLLVCMSWVRTGVLVVTSSVRLMVTNFIDPSIIFGRTPWYVLSRFPLRMLFEAATNT